MSKVKLTGGILFNVAIFAVFLFLPAQTFDWWRAWVFLVVVFIGAIASTLCLLRFNPELLEERFKPPVQKGQPLVDKIITVLLLVAFVLVIVFIPLDVFRWHLIPKPAAFVSVLGLALFIVGWWIMTLALLENAFAAPVVKHQEERQQKVIDTGVYRVVRHPMYAGAIPLLIGMPLWLESCAAAILAIVPTAILVVRILFEERFLRRTLSGYDSYMQRVRYRLIPFVW